MKKIKSNPKFTRRQILKAGLYGGAAMMIPWKLRMKKAFADALNSHIGLLSDPETVEKFVIRVPDALDPSFIYTPVGRGGGSRLYRVGVSPIENHIWGQRGGSDLTTNAWGYGGSWPGMTFEVQSYRPVQIQWENNLFGVDEHLLPVDTSLHWCFSLPGYHKYSIADNGVPIVTHVHGHHSQYRSDGNPEQFFTPRWRVTGPRFRGRTSIYHNDQSAANLWYHDHALGITRLNVYAGLAGFYFIRDDIDTGLVNNPLELPAWPYEKAYAIQCRMFENGGQLFYPAFEGDPFYDEFIGDIPDGLPNNPFSNLGGPTALAEFFGDHIVVNGKAWPFEPVEPRNYRLHLLNGTDSRFMVIRFRDVGVASNKPTTIPGSADILNFYVIGGDQGLASEATEVNTLVFEPGSRYDIVINFSGLEGSRIIMENIGGDSPFGGAFGDDLEPGDFFDDRQTDRIMAFDVVENLDESVPDLFDSDQIGPYQVNANEFTRTRKVALFEGSDNYGRLQPLLGTAEDATDFIGRPIINPDTGEPFNGAIAWHSPTTENPALNATEIWEIYNATGDAHPIHLHLVHFDVLDRYEFVAEIISQPVLQHDGTYGNGFRLSNIVVDWDNAYDPGEAYVENMPKDMVTALPTQIEEEPLEGTVYGQVTRIKVTFDKPGRYVWHCHILSHEDHEMMRTLYVGPEH